MGIHQGIRRYGVGEKRVSRKLSSEAHEQASNGARVPWRKLVTEQAPSRRGLSQELCAVGT